MNSSWIRADVDFDLPWKELTIAVRRIAQERASGRLKCDLTKEDPNELAFEIAHLIYYFRPNLGDGRLIVAGMHHGRSFDQLRIAALHPSFSHVQVFPGERPNEERLELCPVCGEPLSTEQQWMSYMNRQEVCSEQCCNKTFPAGHTWQTYTKMSSLQIQQLEGNLLIGPPDASPEFEKAWMRLQNEMAKGVTLEKAAEIQLQLPRSVFAGEEAASAAERAAKLELVQTEIDRIESRSVRSLEEACQLNYLLKQRTELTGKM